MQAVEASLSSAQTMYRERRIDEFQLEMVEAAAMHLMLPSDLFEGIDETALRWAVRQQRKGPFNIWAAGATRTALEATGKQEAARPPSAPPPPPASTPQEAGGLQSGSASRWLTGAVLPADQEVADSGGSASSSRQPVLSEYKWQVKVGKKGKMKWRDADPSLDSRLEAAFVGGWDSTTWCWDGWTYYYELGDTMTQSSPEGSDRPIRRIRRDEDA